MTERRRSARLAKLPEEDDGPIQLQKTIPAKRRGEVQKVPVNNKAAKKDPAPKRTTTRSRAVKVAIVEKFQPEIEEEEKEDDEEKEESPTKKPKLAVDVQLKGREKGIDEGEAASENAKKPVREPSPVRPESQLSNSGRPRRSVAPVSFKEAKKYEEDEGILMPISSSSSSNEDSEDEFRFVTSADESQLADTVEEETFEEVSEDVEQQQSESNKKDTKKMSTVSKKAVIKKTLSRNGRASGKPMRSKKKVVNTESSFSSSEEMTSSEDEDLTSDEDVSRRRPAGKNRPRPVRSAPKKKPVKKGGGEGSRSNDVSWPACSNANKKTLGGGGSGGGGGSRGLRHATSTKPEQPWKRNLEGYNKERKMAKGERRMAEFRFVARALSKGRTEEISYAEAFKILQEMKKAYHEGRKLIEIVEKAERAEQLAEEGNKESSSEDEWEEMEHFQPIADSQSLEVTMEKEGEDEKDWWAVYLRQEINKRVRETYENTHKVHLLCYMTHLNSLVRTSLDEHLVPSLILSQVPGGYMKYVGEPLPVDVAQKLLKWFTDAFRPLHGVLAVTALEKDLKEGQQARYPATSRLTALVASKCYETDCDRAVLLFCLLVGLDCTARICVNARVIPRKWEKEMLEGLTRDMETFRERSSTPPVVIKEEGDEDVKGKAGPSSNKKGGKKEKPKTTEKAKKPKEERNYWVEYWFTRQKRWICLDPLGNTVDDPMSFAKDAGGPINYVFAIDDKRGICEVAQRYAADCVKQEFRRRRTDQIWLSSTLRLPGFAANDERLKLEKMQMHQDLVKRPLPTTLSEYKNHPLYVLEKDLLKFEAIYPLPEKQKPLGNIRGHNVFPRSTVFTLQGSTNWVKLARSVKEGETAYKMVKARPDPRVPVEDRVDRFLEVFGFWQTEPYRRPVVKNGKIPRNEYGNVYMFQPTAMCPIGTVHLKLPGLMQISRRLNKECVACVVGWDFSGGATHPVIDGCVVLEKDVDVFVEEWNRIDAGRAAKEEQKRVDRVYGNWKKLIRGILRLHYVRNRFGDSSMAAENAGAASKDRKGKKPKAKDAGGKNAKGEGENSSTSTVVDNTKMAKPMEGFSLDDLLNF